MDIDDPPKQTPSPATTTDNDDDDPIIASYPIYLNPSLPASRKLYILQQPNRLSAASALPVATEMRLKPNSGMVELDVPIDYLASNYDRDKGTKWGRALHLATAARNGGSLGLPGGFGVGSGPATAKGSGARRRKHVEGTADVIEDDAILDWQEAIRHDRLLRTQTLGGQVPTTGEVQYMVGVFQGQDLHLTPASSLVHLRPQLHHIDSTTAIQERAGSAKGDAANPPTTQAPARAIHMTIKTTDGGDTVTTETMTDRLRAVQLEPWNKLRYTDENEEAAWDVYSESLFLKGHAPPADTGAEEKGKEPAPSIGTVPEDVQKLERAWNDEKLLRAISDMKKGRNGHQEKRSEARTDQEGAAGDGRRRVKFESNPVA